MTTPFPRQILRVIGSRAVIVAGLFWVGALAQGGENPESRIERGRELFKQCQACHAIGPVAQHGVGPHLNELLGRRIAGTNGYAYSDAMTQAGKDGQTWSAASLDAWLRSPATFAPGSRMGLVIDDESDRAALIAMLGSASENFDFVTGPSNDPPLPAEVLALQGDPAYGEYLASECVTCHQVDGSNKGIPSITGWPEKVFVQAMHAYKRKSRPNEVMQNVAGALGNDEIAALASWFTTLK